MAKRLKRKLPEPHRILRRAHDWKRSDTQSILNEFTWKCQKCGFSQNRRKVPSLYLKAHAFIVWKGQVRVQQLFASHQEPGMFCDEIIIWQIHES